MYLLTIRSTFQTSHGIRLANSPQEYWLELVHSRIGKE
jgi:hypothetical protein